MFINGVWMSFLIAGILSIIITILVLKREVNENLN